MATGALDPFARNTPEAKRYTVGPFAEWRFSNAWSLYTGIEYKRTGDRYASCTFTYCLESSARANLWEAPLLLRWRIGQAEVAPFVSVGYAYRRIAQGRGNLTSWRSGPIVLGEEVDYTVYSSTQRVPGENTHGGVAGGGIEFQAKHLKVAPEFRYTRWNKRYWEQYGSRGYFTGSNLNQMEILLGLRF